MKDCCDSGLSPAEGCCWTAWHRQHGLCGSSWACGILASKSLLGKQKHTPIRRSNEPGWDVQEIYVQRMCKKRSGEVMQANQTVVLLGAFEWIYRTLLTTKTWAGVHAQMRFYGDGHGACVPGGRSSRLCLSTTISLPPPRADRCQSGGPLQARVAWPSQLPFPGLLTCSCLA